MIKSFVGIELDHGILDQDVFQFKPQLLGFCIDLHGKVTVHSA